MFKPETKTNMLTIKNWAIFLFSILITGFTSAQNIIENQWIIQLEKGKNKNSLIQKTELENAELISLSNNQYLISFSNHLIDQESYIKKELMAIRYMPNMELERRAVPNDELFNQLWNMEIIQAVEAWDFTQGGNIQGDKEIVAAIIDDGFDINHEDLQGNIWTNTAEIANNGIDDDANNYIDDISGANMITDNGSHQSRRHGTAVAGIMGAKGNNEIGVAGINWNIKMMLLSSVNRVDRIFKAYEYIYDQRNRYNSSGGVDGAYVVVNNLSLGVSDAFGSENPMWCDWYDQLGSVGVLSIGATVNSAVDVGIAGDLPSTCNSDHLIIVTNSDQFDQLESGSGFSDVWVDLAAPGDILTLDVDDQYRSFVGTSGSTPHVAGLVALMYSVECENLYQESLSNPESTNLFIRQTILDNVDSSPTLRTSTSSGGRINVFQSIINMQGSICGGSSSAPLSLNISGENPTQLSQLEFTYTTDSFDQHRLSIFDSSGRLIDYLEFVPDIFGSRTIRLEVDPDSIKNYPDQIYFATIENEVDKASAKFVVQN